MPNKEATAKSFRCIQAICAICITLGGLAPVRGESQNLELNKAAVRVPKTYCHRCHGVSQKLPDFDVLDRHSLTKLRGSDLDEQFVMPGDLDGSVLWQYVEGDDAYMPQDGSPESEKITISDRDTIRRWIKSGAQFPIREERTVRKQVDDFIAIREYLLNAQPESRRSLRFFSLSHLVNNNSRYSEQDLRLVRAAVSKLLNSLSWQSKITVPTIVPGTAGSILAIDLRDLGWNSSQQWLNITNHYPYGLKYDYVADVQLKAVAADVRELTAAEISVLRADWLVFTAARAPLYHDLLELPTDIETLERLVGVNVHQNIVDGKAARAAFGRSGVSRQNRLVERHASKFGAYWISYDFLPRRGRGDLIRYPLGPRFPANRYNRHAFAHDGGEAIFHLPNGLQGYYLVTADGTRIDGPAPADVVYDSAAIAGTPAIVNGLSCMNCHREGMISGFRDEIRDSGALNGEPLEKVRQLYLPVEQMDRLVAEDRQQYLTALKVATGGFLQVAEDAGKSISEFPEPIGQVAQRYLADLGPTEVALELGVASIEDVRAPIEHDRDLRKLGLGTLIQDQPGTIKRARWEAIDGTSFFQDVAVELRLGTPILPGTTRTMKSVSRFKP
jgi:serine/threonine-protein kinase